MQQQLTFNIDFEGLLAANKPQGTKALLQAMQDTRKSTVLSMVLADGPILAGDVVAQAESTLLAMGKHERLDLFLRSTGGIAEVPWRIISLLREFCEQLSVIVPRVAMSGATHIAIAGDELVMGPLSTLGSVDPTRNHPLLPPDRQGNPIPTSVQNLQHCLSFLKRTLREGDPMGPIVKELFTHVNPLALGALEESYSLARLITEKALRSRKKPLDAKTIDKIKEKLSGEYFSHAFCISRSEVEQDLELPVTRMDLGQALFNQSEALISAYNAAFQTVTQLQGTPIPLQLRLTGFVECSENRHILGQVFAPNGQLIAGSWIAQDNS